MTQPRGCIQAVLHQESSGFSNRAEIFQEHRPSSILVLRPFLGGRSQRDNHISLRLVR